MSLDQKDLELIEHIVYKNGDDIAVSIARSFQRLEERIEALESRLSSRLSEAEERIESGRQDSLDAALRIKEDIRDFLRAKEVAAYDRALIKQTY
jgi:tRNA(His) 5'-end guanylyltransferase